MIGANPEVLRIGNCSGFYGDRVTAMAEMLDGGDLDVLTGDYLAELTMLILGRDRMKDPATGYAKTFLAQVRDCLRLALDRGVRLVANAGGVNTAGLVAAIRALASEQGLAPRIAWVRGDDLTARAADLGLGRPLGAHAYLGGAGIAAALAAGADLVVTGRITDASLVVGPAMAHFGWERTDVDRLAGATVAGHVLECGTQATGGNFPFFTEIADLVRPGFPIAEVHRDGSSVITKHPGSAGAVTTDTVLSQLLYEIGDARYAGPDVTTRLDSIRLDPDGVDRVRISGVVGEPPPPDVKVSLTAIGGFRNELTLVLTGLDIEAKADLARRQFLDALPTRPAQLTWRLARLDRADAPTQQEAAALLTVVGRDPDERAVGRGFANAAVEVALGSYPGFFATSPPAAGSPYGVFTPGFVPQGVPAHEVVHDDGRVEAIAPPTRTQPLAPATGGTDKAAGGHPAPAGEDPGPEWHDASAGEKSGPGWEDASGGEDSAYDLAERTRRRPLGTLAGARSGDKGGAANIGVWVRDARAYPWLAGLLTEDRVRALIPEAAGLPITITRLPNLRAVNIVLDGLLGEGVAFNARFDPQAKGLGEWLRSRVVDIPESLLPQEQQ